MQNNLDLGDLLLSRIGLQLFVINDYIPIIHSNSFQCRPNLDTIEYPTLKLIGNGWRSPNILYTLLTPTFSNVGLTTTNPKLSI